MPRERRFPSSPQRQKRRSVSLSYMNWDTCVKTYLLMVLNGCPKELRPTVCLHCAVAAGFHRHGYYSRMLYTLEEALKIVIFRFKCKNCKKTFGLLPSFVERYQSVAVEVKELVISNLDDGVPLRVVAEQLDLPTAPYSEKSLWRWKKKWDWMLEALEPVFWRTVLTHIPHLHLPRGSESPRSSWEWLFLAWKAVRGRFTDNPRTGCLQWLIHLARLSAVTV